MARKLVGLLIVVCAFALGVIAAQKPLERFLVRSDTVGALTLHSIENQKTEDCWLVVESSRGLAIVRADLAVCHDTEME